jgi:hypothetical protein
VDEPLQVPEQWVLADAAWRKKPPTEKQLQILRKLNLKQEHLPVTSGEASDLITLLRVERDANLRLPATAKQLYYMRANKLAAPAGCTKGEAMRLIVAHRRGKS